eukprot:Rhum_TRINITY_DN9388_c0_g1::Rhum_TRINITY_DN9388_c0_g1_i1::g.33189::m.33189
MLSRSLTRASPSQQQQRYCPDGGLRVSPSLLNNGAPVSTVVPPLCGDSPCGVLPPYPPSSPMQRGGGRGGGGGSGSGTPPDAESHHTPQRVLQFRNLVEATRSATYPSPPGTVSSSPPPPQAPTPPKLGRSRRGSMRVRASAAPLSPGVRSRVLGGDGGGSCRAPPDEHAGAAAVLSLLQFRPVSPSPSPLLSSIHDGADSVPGSTSGLCGSGLSLMDRCLSVSLGSSWMHDGSTHRRNPSLPVAAAASLASSGASVGSTHQQQQPQQPQQQRAPSTTRRTFGSHKSSSFKSDLGLLLAASGSSFGSPCELLGGGGGGGGGSCATASSPSTGAGSVSFAGGLRPRPQNLTEFAASELPAHVLSRALHALCPPGRPWSREQLVRTRDAALASAAALAATCAADAYLAERHLQQCVERVGRALASGAPPPPPPPGVVEASLY